VAVRQVGVEEEMLLVDPRTGRLRAVSDRAVRAHARADGGDGLDQELFLQQIESASSPQQQMGDLLADLRKTRRAALDAAKAAGAVAVAVPVPLLADEDTTVTPEPRYESMLEEFVEVGREAGVCGMHVHVDVDSDEEAVGVADRIRPWLAVLSALAVNSPYHRGIDTGYASWRSHVWDRWPTAGPVEPFGNVVGYRSAVRDLLASGAAIDVAMIYFDARLAASYPTLEIRVADVCTDLRDAVLVATLARAVVDTAARAWRADEPIEPWRVDLLRAARWRATRDGVSGQLLDPATRTLEPAATVLASMLAWAADSLAATGDTCLAHDGIERVLSGGTGAQRQRRVAGDGMDLRAVVDDLRIRTEESCG